MDGHKAPLRVAFLTPEYVTEDNGHGGAAQATAKFVHGFRLLGHEPEVFVSRDGDPRVIEHEGVRVERAGYALPRSPRWQSFVQRPEHWAHWLALLGKPKPVLLLADSFRRRDSDRPFDVVVSQLLGAAGALVTSRPGRPHVVRVTASIDQQLREWNGRLTPTRRVLLRLWRHQLRQADAVIAPCELAAQSYSAMLGRAVEVVRTPAWREVEPAGEVPSELPARFLLHVGRLGPTKGTFDVAAALTKCWAVAPELRMVWLGNLTSSDVYEHSRAMWGGDADKVQWLGAVDKAVLYAIMRRATACVLPSHIDNLPNTAIESLMFEVPVIGTRGTSLDELVEHGRSGEIVEPAQPEQLAQAMLRMWRGESTCQRRGFARPKVLEQMTPEAAAQRLIEVASAARNGRV